MTRYLPLLCLFGVAACKGPSTDIELGEPGPAVSLRVVHGTAGGPSIDLCVVREDGTEGPLLGTELAFGSGSARIDVTAGAQAFLVVESGDCDAIVGQATPPTAEGDWTLFVGETDWSTPYDATGLTWIEDTWPDTLEGGRFYARFFNGALDVDGASVKQFGCDTPFAAFENTASGEVGFAPNNQAATFSASVDADTGAFTADLFYCENIANALVELPQHTFDGGELQTHYLLGDGAETPFQVLSCLETSPSETCEPL